MARIRTIKPEFWTDEKVVELSPLARLLFIGLWNFADDEGRMVFSPTRIKLQILPADSGDISALLGEIRGKGLIVIYAVDGTEYLQVSNFALHQKVDKRTASKYPPPPDTPAEFPRIVPTDQGRDQGRDQGKAHPGYRAFSPPPWIPPEAWAGFEEHRKKIRKPMTDKARALIVRELEKLKPDDPVEVIEQSIRNGWQDVFALRQKSGVAKETALRADL